MQQGWAIITKNIWVMSKDEQRIHASWIHSSLHPWRYRSLGPICHFYLVPPGRKHVLCSTCPWGARDVRPSRVCWIGEELELLHTRCVISLCMCKSHWCGVCIQSKRLALSGAAWKDLDKGPESLHPTWRKSPSGESKCVWETWTVLLLLLFGQEFLWSHSDRVRPKRCC